MSKKFVPMLVLIALCTVALVAGSQSPAEPFLPEVGSFVSQAVAQQRLTESKEQGYVFREDVNINKLRKECTWAPQCPGIGVNYKVLKYTQQNFEIFWLDGIRVARVLPHCDPCAGQEPGETYIQKIPLSANESVLGNQLIDSEVAAAKANLAQGKDPGLHVAVPQILFSRMLQLCTFTNPRRQLVKGRPTVLLDFNWNPSAKPESANETILKSFSGVIAIDETDHAVEEVQGKFLADVNLDSGEIKIRKGTKVTLTNVRVDTGVWLLSSLRARGEARYYSLSFDGESNIFAGRYQKFRAGMRILPDPTGALTNAPPPSIPKP